MKVKVGLVTVLYNSDDVLEGFFESLSKQTFKDYHLYLIDNMVNDITNQLILNLTEKYAIVNFTHIKNPNNAGVSEGNNQGISLSRSIGATHTVLLNNDIEFSQETLLEEMYDVAITQKEHLIIPKIFYFDTGLIWMAGGSMKKWRGTTVHVGDGDTDGPKYEVNNYFTYAPTCFMMISNEVFDKIGIMDTEYFVYYDDTDFIYRAIDRGYEIYLMANLHVNHKVSSSTGGDLSTFSVYYMNRNKLYFMRKNLKGIVFIVAIFYTVLSRIRLFCIYDSALRSKLIEGIKDGFKKITINRKILSQG